MNAHVVNRRITHVSCEIYLINFLYTYRLICNKNTDIHIGNKNTVIYLKEQRWLTWVTPTIARTSRVGANVSVGGNVGLPERGVGLDVEYRVGLAVVLMIIG